MFPKTLNTFAALVSVLGLGLSVAGAQTLVYVDADADLDGDGTSWETAYKYLQDALIGAAAGTDIRVAQGTYKPDQDEGGIVTDGNRTATFQLVNEVGLYGGYRGCPGGDCGSGNPDERDIDLYETILSGDLLGDDGPDFANNEENSARVVTGSGTDETAVLNGSSITAGNGDWPFLPYDSEGGGLFNKAGSPTVTSCRIISNSAEEGAGVFNESSSNPTLTNCTFSENLAERDGGGMYNRKGSNPTLTNCTFSGNESGDGGGMYNKDASPTLTNCTFSGNTGSIGAGMYNLKASPTLTDCVFTGNSSSSAGGGIYNWSSNVSLTNCTFSDNTSGGGVWSWSDSTLIATNCTFTGNSYSGIVHQGGTLVLSYCTLSLNSSASGYSAGLDLHVDTDGTGFALLTNCIFNDNSARDGGGMVINQGNPTLINCIFRNNSAEREGGGLNIFADCNPTVINSTFIGNSAGDNGGAVVNRGDNSLFANCTFYGNTADDDAGGIYNTSTAGVEVANSILWGNVEDADGSDGGPFVQESAQIQGGSSTVSYTSIQNLIPGGDLDDGTNIADDPLFADPDGPDGTPGTEDDNLRLSAGSPCIDAADNTAVPGDVADLDGDGDAAERTPLDLDVKPRFVDDPDTEDTGVPDPPDYPEIVDMGAYEFPGSCATAAECDDGNDCTIDTCGPQNVCVNEFQAQVYADICMPYDPPGGPQPNLDDILCGLDDFADGDAVDGCTCNGFRNSTDLHPCPEDGGGDGEIALDDILNMLDAFAGLSPCDDPCPG